MQKPSPDLWELSRRLLAACQSALDERVNVATTVNEKWRASITKFAGAEGFASLQRRALSLASADMPALQTVTAGADGRLDRLEQLGPTATRWPVFGSVSVRSGHFYSGNVRVRCTGNFVPSGRHSQCEG